MTAGSYRSVGTLADYFLGLLSKGFSERAALERLRDEIHTGRLICDPTLQGVPYRPKLIAGGLMIETADAMFPAAEFQATRRQTLIPVSGAKFAPGTLLDFRTGEVVSVPLPVVIDAQPLPAADAQALPAAATSVDEAARLEAKKQRRRGPRPMYAWETLIVPHFTGRAAASLGDVRDAVLARFQSHGKAVPHPRYVEKWILKNHPELVAEPEGRPIPA